MGRLLRAGILGAVVPAWLGTSCGDDPGMSSDATGQPDSGTADSSADAGTDSATADAWTPDVTNDTPTETGPDAPIDAPPLDPLIVCQTYAAAICDKIALCTFVTLTSDELVQCEKLYFEMCQHAMTLKGSSLSNVDHCAQTIALTGCDELYYGKAQDNCKGLGTLGGGEPCAAFECATSCVSSSPDFCGTCRAPAQAGGACSKTSQCPKYHGCVSSTCVALAYLGETCGATQPCASPMRCESGVCIKSGAAGDSCLTSLDCDKAQGAFNCISGKCEAWLLYGPGEPCNVLGGTCPYFHSCIDDVCTAQKPLGAACSAHNECSGVLARCWNSQCVLATPEGCPTTP